MDNKLCLSIFTVVIIIMCVHSSFAIPLRYRRAVSYIANETACTVDSVVYKDGDPIPTDDPCESCKCRPPGFSCVLRECEVKIGCKAIRREGKCCPEYQCGCEHNGHYYRDGDRIPNAESPCYSCYCQGSSITCSLADCKFRFDCEPEYVQGECCPKYDHCQPEFGSEVTVKSTSIPLLTTFVTNSSGFTTLKPSSSSVSSEVTTEAPFPSLPTGIVQTETAVSSSSTTEATFSSTSTHEPEITTLKVEKIFEPTLSSGIVETEDIVSTSSTTPKTVSSTVEPVTTSPLPTTSPIQEITTQAIPETTFSHEEIVHPEIIPIITSTEKASSEEIVTTTEAFKYETTTEVVEVESIKEVVPPVFPPHIKEVVPAVLPVHNVSSTTTPETKPHVIQDVTPGVIYETTTLQADIEVSTPQTHSPDIVAFDKEKSVVDALHEVALAEQEAFTTDSIPSELTTKLIEMVIESINTKIEVADIPKVPSEETLIAKNESQSIPTTTSPLSLDVDKSNEKKPDIISLESVEEKLETTTSFDKLKPITTQSSDIIEVEKFVTEQPETNPKIVIFESHSTEMPKNKLDQVDVKESSQDPVTTTVESKLDLAPQVTSEIIDTTQASSGFSEEPTIITFKYDQTSIKPIMAKDVGETTSPVSPIIAGGIFEVETEAPQVTVTYNTSISSTSSPTTTPTSQVIKLISESEPEKKRLYETQSSTQTQPTMSTKLATQATTRLVESVHDVHDNESTVASSPQHSPPASTTTESSSETTVFIL